MSGLPAHRIDFDLHDVDRAQAGDSEAHERVTLVLIDPGFVSSVGPNSEDARDFKTLLVAGYSNRPDDFEAGARDFEGLLQRIVFAEREAGETTCTVPAPEVASSQNLDVAAADPEPQSASDEPVPEESIDSREETL